MNLKKILISSLCFLVFLLVINWYYRLPHYRSLGSRGYIVTYYVGHRPELRAQYVIISRVDGHIVVEIIRGAGSENVERLDGKAAEAYLVKWRLI